VEDFSNDSDAEEFRQNHLWQNHFSEEGRWMQMKSVITTLYLRSSAFIRGLIPLNSSGFMILGVEHACPVDAALSGLNWTGSVSGSTFMRT